MALAICRSIDEGVIPALSRDPFLSVATADPVEENLFLSLTERNSRFCSKPVIYPPVAMANYVYMMASKKGGTLYIGVTSDLSRRVHEHKSGLTPGFTKRHGVTRLVWYEEHPDIRDAIQREKSLKRWRREWKITLVETINPGWHELYRGMGW